MCLITIQNDPCIAQEDLIVYKSFLKNTDENIFKTPFQFFTYEINKLYETEIKLVKKTEFIGIEAFDNDSIDKSKLDFDVHKYINVISNGFHSLKYPDRIDTDSIGLFGLKIVECIVPKGSFYYTDNSGLIVSNKIIITNKIV